MHILGVDIGTTGVKTTAFNQEAVVCAYSYEPYSIKEDRIHNYYEIDIDFLLEQTLKAINRTIEQLKTDRIEAICVTSFGETFVMLDYKDQVIFDPILYIDKRGDKEAEVFREKFGADFFYNHAGVNPNGMYSLSKLKWLYDNNPKLIVQAKKLLSVSSYILYRLGADEHMDYTLASRTMGFDIHNKIWLNECFDYVGVDKSVLPPLVSTGTKVGKLSDQLQNKFNLNNKPILITGGHDHATTAVGGGISEPGQSINSLGTTDCLTFSFDNDEYISKLASYNLASVPYLDTDMYVSYAFNMSGGAVLNWFTNIFQVPKEDTLHVMDKNVPDNVSEIIVVPNLSGSGTPDLNPHDFGIVSGLRLSSDVNAIYKACLEGVCFTMKRNVELVKSIGIVLKKIRTVGGGAKSNVWMQMRSDVFNMPIETLTFNEAGTLGSAILFLLALGVYNDLKSAQKNFLTTKKIFQPRKESVDIYKKLYEKFSKLYEITKSN